MTPPPSPPSNTVLEGILAALQAIAVGVTESNAHVASVIAENADGNRVRVNSVTG